MDYNSLKNQKIKEEFVKREVYCCESSVVDYILRTTYDSMEYFKDAPFNYEDIENQYIDNSDRIEELEERINNLKDEKDTIEDEMDLMEEEGDEDYSVEEGQADEIEAEIQNLESEKEELELQQEEPVEVYEWWKVSGWLCEKLKDMGEVVIPHMQLWGRGVTGQSISLDYTISKICEDMEILEGQKYDWSKYIK